MKRILALAFAGLLAMSAPAEAAKYVTFDVKSASGELHVTFDSQAWIRQTNPFIVGTNYYVTPQNLRFVWGSYPDPSYDYNTTRAGKTVFSVDLFLPTVDLSASSFSYTFKPTFNGFLESFWFQYVLLERTPPDVYDNYLNLIPVDQVQVTGADTAPGGVGWSYSFVSRDLPPFIEVPGVPETPIWAMMLGGFGAIGALLRRKGRRWRSVSAG